MDISRFSQGSDDSGPLLIPNEYGRLCLYSQVSSKYAELLESKKEVAELLSKEKAYTHTLNTKLDRVDYSRFKFIITSVLLFGFNLVTLILLSCLYFG